MRITFKQKLTAIKGSIEKWDKVSQGKEDGTSRENCPLCTLYWCKDFHSSSCHNCPIYKKTGESDCIGTPYQKFRELYERHGDSEDLIQRGELSLAAAIFRDWLKDLYIEVSEAGDGGERAVEEPEMSETQKLTVRVTNLSTNLVERIEKIEKEIEDKWVYFVDKFDKSK